MILENEQTDRYIPSHEFVGNKYINGVGYYLSFKAPARLSDLKNDGLVEIIWVKGETGANYQAFRLKK